MVSQSLLSSIDIAPTLLDVAGVKLPESFQGKSFRKVLDNPTRPFRKYVFAEHNWHDFMAFERMVRTDRFLYIENGLPEQDNRGAIDVMGGGAGRALNEGWENNALSVIHRQIFEIPQPRKEFYDCQEDTLQVHNLMGTDQFAREQKKLAAVLNVWRIETGDTQPDELTRDWYDRTSNKPLAEKGRRGTWPGKAKNAHEIHSPGPF
jgi:arylsulfatase A-like enzyme